MLASTFEGLTKILDKRNGSESKDVARHTFVKTNGFSGQTK